MFDHQARAGLCLAVVLALVCGVGSLSLSAVDEVKPDSNPDSKKVAAATKKTSSSTVESSKSGKSDKLGKAGKSGTKSARKQVNPADVKALGPLQAYIGSWRGVGAPRRGDTKGMWEEQSDWAWSFDGKRSVIGFSAPKGKYFVAGRIEAGKKPGEFVFTGTGKDGKTKYEYVGGLDKDKQLLFKAPKTSRSVIAKAGLPAQISLRLVARGKRLVIVYQKRIGDGEHYAQIGEIGYTRKGSGFGKSSVTRECVVTGGQSTTLVVFEGKSYYVCCSGCRKYFQEDPAAAIAEYKERKALEAKKKKQKESGA